MTLVKELFALLPYCFFPHRSSNPNHMSQTHTSISSRRINKFNIQTANFQMLQKLQATTRNNECSLNAHFYMTLILYAAVYSIKPISSQIKFAFPL